MVHRQFITPYGLTVNHQSPGALRGGSGGGAPAACGQLPHILDLRCSCGCFLDPGSLIRSKPAIIRLHESDQGRLRPEECCILQTKKDRLQAVPFQKEDVIRLLP